MIETLLQENYGLAVQFSETRVVCVEKPSGTGQAVDVMGAAENPFYATVGFRVEPGTTGSGISYTLEVKLGSLPLAFHRAIEETALNQFELSAPIHAISQALFKLSALQATFERPLLRGETFLLTGTLPVATTEEFQRSLHSFTEGEGIFLTKPSGFRKLESAYPTRKRADSKPLNRRDYMLHVLHAY
ncbi:MAG: hypothetical protein M3Z08_00125 [Chloroflexota bacterium]|nr:hypothetical protein [Chloroflexota bacterium]